MCVVGKGRKKERLGERKRGRGGEGDVGDRRSLMGEGGREGGRKERREERHAACMCKSICSWIQAPYLQRRNLVSIDSQ